MYINTDISRCSFGSVRHIPDCSHGMPCSGHTVAVGLGGPSGRDVRLADTAAGVSGHR
jgi:hypothetical protein